MKRILLWAALPLLLCVIATVATRNTATRNTATRNTATRNTATPELPTTPDSEAPLKRTQRVYSTTVERDQLRALPYADATFDPAGHQRGVILHIEDKAWDGLNFCSSRDLPAAFLFDMKGKFVYQWRSEGEPWQHVDLLPSGEVIALIKDTRLIKVDRNSKVLWSHEARVHHDHWRAGDGRIYVLSRKTEKDPRIHRQHKILVDYLTILSSDGRRMDEISIHDMLLNSRYSFLMPSVHHRDLSEKDEKAEEVELDLLHNNHVEVLNGSIDSPAFKAGNVLLSFRHIDTIAVADLERREIVWAWGPGNLTRQHHPVALDNGHLLIFNNGLLESNVIELDPKTFEITWLYSNGKDFFTQSRGSNVRLPNGNTLITESDTGYAFEVTPEGEMVWEFANPRINEESERSAIWRVVRFAHEELPFLAEN